MALEEIKFEVLGIVCDNNAINKKSVSMFSDPPSIRVVYTHPCDASRPLFYIVDSVHILKCIRNNWLNQKDAVLNFPNFKEECGGIASLEALRILHRSEKSNLLKYGYGLTLKALYPSTIERQNVKLALKIFNSNSVTALSTYGKSHGIENSESTALFIGIICKWWDIVNVKTIYKGQRLRNPFQEPIKESSNPVFEFMDEVLIWLDNWKNSDSCGRLTNETHFALRQTTDGLMKMAKYILEEKKKSFFLPGKVQTDCLEDRFGKYRQMSGGNYHISLRQICETENKIRLQNILPVILHSSEAGEITVSVNDVFDDVISADNNLASTSASTSIPFFTTDDADIDSIDDETWPLLHYIGGYSAHSAIRKLQCSYCEQFLVSPKLCAQDSLIFAQDRGGLQYPSEDVVLCVAHTFVVASKLLKDWEHLFLQGGNQKRILKNFSFQNLPHSLFSGHACVHNHDLVVIKSIILSTTANILLNNYIKKINDISKRKNVTNYKRFKTFNQK